MKHLAAATTILPGLSVSLHGTPSLIHNATQTALMHFPCGLTRVEMTGDTRQWWIAPLSQRHLLISLAHLDWEGQVTPAHEQAVHHLKQATVSLEAARRHLDRCERLQKGLDVLMRMMLSPRGQLLNRASLLLITAQQAASTAQTPAQKGKATRQLRQAHELLRSAGFTPQALERFKAPSTARTLFDGLTKCAQWQRMINDARSARIERGREQARQYLNGDAQPVSELRIALMLTGSGGDLLEAYRQGKGATPLKTANQERLRRQRFGETLHQQNPEIRALTRHARIEAGKRVLRQRPKSRHAAEFRALLSLFETVQSFRTAAVRASRTGDAIQVCAAAFPDEQRRHAVHRGIHKHLSQEAREGRMIYRREELPSECLSGSV